MMATKEPTPAKVVIVNKLPLDVDIYEFDPTATPVTYRYAKTVPADTTQSIPASLGSLRAVISLFGAVVGKPYTVPTTNAGTYTISPRTLVNPFEIGSPPAPSAQLLLPPDTVPQLVGVGLWEPPKDDAASKIVVTREQFWHKAPQSFSLPPKATERKTLRQTNGRMATSSTSTSASDEISTNATAGWGPFSASVSASLSTTSQRTDTVTIRESNTTTVVQEFTNNTTTPVVVYLWQLIERIRITVGPVCKIAVDSAIGPLLPMQYPIAAKK